MTTYWDGSYPPSVLHPEPPVVPLEDAPDAAADAQADAPTAARKQDEKPPRPRKRKTTEE